MRGEWSIKDILAHITAWERRLLGWLHADARGEIPVRPEPGASWADLDLLNARTYREHRDRPLADVLAAYHRTYQEMLQRVEALSEEDVVNPERFVWMNHRPLHLSISAITYKHYREHLEAIQTWLQKGKMDV